MSGEKQTAQSIFNFTYHDQVLQMFKIRNGEVISQTLRMAETHSFI